MKYDHQYDDAAKGQNEIGYNSDMSNPEPFENNSKPSFEMLPIRTDGPDFIDRLLTTNREFRALLESRRKEADEGRTISLDEVRKQLG